MALCAVAFFARVPNADAENFAMLLVECSCPVGMGHRRGQLRHLSEPHYGSLSVYFTAG